MKLGVFDSGIGGEAVARALQVSFPSAQMIVINDKANVPYGDKSSDEVIRLTDTAIQPLLSASCDIIILACNTATAAAIEILRAHYPTQKFIGIEPMIKTAASLSKTNTIAVCATPATLSSERYRQLIARYGTHLDIIKPDCSTWAYMIESNQLNHEMIKQTVTDVCNRGADVIVLGCTHYHWIKEEILQIAAGRAQVIEPSEAIGRRVAALLEQASL
ncbi:MAG TPA: glutamate racemase [Candidatus Saccharimonadales bacterium]